MQGGHPSRALNRPFNLLNCDAFFVNDTPFQYIDDAAGLRQLTQKLIDSPSIALDTEANSLHNYYERVCLMQLSIDNEHFVLDPLAEIDLAPFLEALRTKDLILHGADYDLRMLRSTFDFSPDGNVYDTMLAAQLLGIESFGYAALVEHFFEERLSKSGQKSNWAKRPLTDAQLRYAADDTRYLASLADLLREELDSHGRVSWHEESCQKMLASTRRKNERDMDEAWRIRGLGGLDRRDLAHLREVWGWREEQAQEADRPAFKIMGNRQLIELAQWAAENSEAPLSDGPRLPRHCEGRRLAALDDAVARARRTPKSDWPDKRKRREQQGVRGNDSKKQIDALRAACAEVADELGIAPSLLAPKAMIVSVIRAKATTPDEMKACSGMMDWQAQLLQEPIREFLSTVSP